LKTLPERLPQLLPQLLEVESLLGEGCCWGSKSDIEPSAIARNRLLLCFSTTTDFQQPRSSVLLLLLLVLVLVLGG